MEPRLKICEKGHKFWKNSDCPTCPICQSERRPTEGILSQIGAPARRALESKGIKTARDLSKYSEADLLKLHGFGPSSLPKLRAALKAEGLAFNVGIKKK